MDWFLCIVFSILAISVVLQGDTQNLRARGRARRMYRKTHKTVHEVKITSLEDRKNRQEAQKQRDRDIADLKKQGYTDDLITMIIPTIENG